MNLRRVYVRLRRAGINPPAMADPKRHPVRNAARSAALPTRDLMRREIPDQRGGISCRSASGMTPLKLTARQKENP